MLLIAVLLTFVAAPAHVVAMRSTIGGFAGEAGQAVRGLSGFSAKLGHNVIESGCYEYARNHRYASGCINKLRCASKNTRTVGRRMLLVEAAKGRKTKRSGSGFGGNNKGFGGFSTATNDDTASCKCGTPDKTYDDCCGKYHTGAELPPTPEALMRSRFC